MGDIFDDILDLATLIEEVKHLPGQHNQLDHGHRYHVDASTGKRTLKPHNPNSAARQRNAAAGAALSAMGAAIHAHHSAQQQAQAQAQAHQQAQQAAAQAAAAAKRAKANAARRARNAAKKVAKQQAAAAAQAATQAAAAAAAKKYTKADGKTLNHADLLTSDAVTRAATNPGYYSASQNRTTGDPTMYHLNKQQGFDGKPELVSETEMDAYVKAGEMELWRGVTDRNGQHENAFAKGDFFAGYGIYGNGTYVAHDHGQDTGLAVGIDYGIKNTGSGVVMRMTLRKDAKLGDYNTLVSEMKTRQGKQQKVVNDLATKMYGTSGTQRTALQSEYEKASAALSVYSDVGRYAVARGYDGYNMTGTGHSYDERYFVLLNRTAVRMSTSIRHYSGSANMSGGSSTRKRVPKPTKVTILS